MQNHNKFYLFFLTTLLALPSIADNPVVVVEEDSSSAEVVITEATVDTSSTTSQVMMASSSDVEEVIVTGSRIKKSTFTSISPLQIITSEVSREAGLINPADILQESTAAAGQQINNSFVGFVLDNGPGASTISLRGLGANRTLLLINGRRVGPGGVEGAPTSPDLNLLPGGLIQRYDVLLDGASSVYGSDAVGGVTNVILRKDFDGWEADMYLKGSPHQSGGHDDQTFTLTYGANSDRWFFGAGLEITGIPEVKLRDRPWTADCEKDFEVTSTGLEQTTLLDDEYNYGMKRYECAYSGSAGYISTPGLGNFGFGPSSLIGYDGLGSINGFAPFSSNSIFPDWDGDGYPDIDYDYYNINGKDTFSSLGSKLNKKSFMAYGEYILEGEGNHTIFFETQYGSRETYSIAGGYQLFPYVPANNPYNICNPEADNGIDCAAYAESMNSLGSFVDTFNNTYSGGATFAFYAPVFGSAYESLYGVAATPHSYYCGADGGNIPSFREWLFGVPISSWYRGSCFPSQAGGEPAQYVRPVVSVYGDRTETNTEVEQNRYVLGIKGDIQEFLFGSNWSYETSAYQTKSTGKSFRSGVRDDRLRFALGLNPNTTTTSRDLAILSDPIDGPCDSTGLTGTRADVLDGCVPVNLFAASLYNTIIGDFGTQAERDYLFSESVYNTEFTQTVYSAFVSGTAFELPAGPVGMVAGAEVRIDKIVSNPDAIRDEGLFFGFAASGGARGQQEISEAYMELAAPLLADKFLAKELNVEVATRFTEIETTNNFTQATQDANGSTWSAKLSWRPINDLLIRGTVGTSYRAPNLREVALRSESGFSTIGDPCNAAPYISLNAETGEIGYNSEDDNREQTTIANCQSAGVDPFTLGYDFENGVAVGTTSTEVISGGSTDLKSESSKSTTFGFVYDVPVNFASITVGSSWYDIEVSDAIIEPSGSYAVYDCYIDKEGYTSTFCSKIGRGSNGLIDKVEAGFLNRDLATARGVDINIRVSKPFTIKDQMFDWGADLTANNLIERTISFTSDVGNPDIEDYAGEPGYPDWSANFRTYLGFNDWRLSWQISYISSVDQDIDSVDTFANVQGVLNDDGDTVTAQTCSAPVLCRDVGYIKSQAIHNLSLYYYGDTLTVGFGLRNAFDTAPPMVNATEISSYSNVPLGYGYNVFGQEAFFNISKRF